MSARAFLVCDHVDCDREWLDTASEPWVMRLRAHENGWGCIDDIDLCPRHAELAWEKR